MKGMEIVSGCGLVGLRGLGRGFGLGACLGAGGSREVYSRRFSALGYGVCCRGVGLAGVGSGGGNMSGKTKSSDPKPAKGSFWNLVFSCEAKEYQWLNIHFHMTVHTNNLQGLYSCMDSSDEDAESLSLAMDLGLLDIIS